MDEIMYIEDYMKPLNDKLTAENKKAYIAGDFNFYLLNTQEGGGGSCTWYSTV